MRLYLFLAILALNFQAAFAQDEDYCVYSGKIIYTYENGLEVKSVEYDGKRSPKRRGRCMSSNGTELDPESRGGDGEASLLRNERSPIIEQCDGTTA